MKKSRLRMVLLTLALCASVLLGAVVATAVVLKNHAQDSNTVSVAWDGEAKIRPSGSGVGSDPFIIETPSNLAYVAQCMSFDNDYVFSVTKDLDLGKHNWTPIGKDNNAFRGTFYGNGFKIFNIGSDKEGDYDTQQAPSLFGTVSSGKIDGVTVEYSFKEAKNTTLFGGIAQKVTDTTISRCANITKALTFYGLDEGCYAGLVAIANNIKISSCYSITNITVKDLGRAVGGLLADAEAELKSSIENSYCAGKISSQTAPFGGISAIGDINCSTVFAVSNSGTDDWISSLLESSDDWQVDPSTNNGLPTLKKIEMYKAAGSSASWACTGKYCTAGANSYSAGCASFTCVHYEYTCGDGLSFTSLKGCTTCSEHGCYYQYETYATASNVKQRTVTYTYKAERDSKDDIVDYNCSEPDYADYAKYTPTKSNRVIVSAGGSAYENTGYEFSVPSNGTAASKTLTVGNCRTKIADPITCGCPIITIDSSVSVQVGSSTTISHSAVYGGAYTSSWSFTSANTSIATVTSAGVVTGVKAGSTTISWKYTPGYINSFPTRSGSVSVTVKSATETISVPTWSGTLTYNGASQSPSWSGYDSNKMTITGNTGTNAGKYTAYFTPKTGYAWSDGTTSSKGVAWAIQTAKVAVSWGTTSFTYDGTTHVPTASVSGVNGEKINLTISGGQKDKGSSTVIASIASVEGGQANASNYTLNANSKTVTVSAKTVTVTWSNTSFTYNGTVQTPTATANSGVSGETINLTVSGGQTNAGSYTATASISSVTGGSTNNYILSNTTKTYTINSNTTGSVVVTLSPDEFEYNGSSHSPGISVTLNGSTLDGSDITYTTSGIKSATSAGTYTITATITSGNYKGSSNSANWSIVAAQYKEYTLSVSNLTISSTSQYATLSYNCSIPGTGAFSTVTSNYAYIYELDSLAAVRRGYDSNGTDQFKLDFTPSDSSTYKPQTVYFNVTVVPLASYTITFNANGGTGSMSPQTVRATIKTRLSSNTFTRTGYTFDGWATSSTGAAVYSNQEYVIWTGSTTLYAHWTKNTETYTLTINPNGGTYGGSTSTTTITKEEGETYPVSTPTRSGYTFAGWSGSGTSNLSGSTYTFNSDGTLTASWTANITYYTVTFDANGGTITSGSSTKSVASGNSYGSFPTATRSGYTFTGWYTSASGGTQKSTSDTVTSSHTLYAHWTQDTVYYTVTFNANGGTFSDGTTSKTISYEEDETYGTFPTASRSGYTFAGWYTSTSGGTLKDEDDTVTSSHTLYAHWIVNITYYTVTFDANGGTLSGSSTMSVASGNSYGSFPTATRSGYTFAGWYTSASGGTRKYTTDTVTSSHTLYAHWTKDTVYVTLTIDPNGGTYDGETTKICSPGDERIIKKPEREGYIFDRWVLEGGGSYSDSDIVPDGYTGSYVFGTSDGTLWATWKLPKLTINPNGGSYSGSTSVEQLIGSSYTLETVTRTHYVLASWSLTGGGSYSNGVYTFGDSDGTLTANWTKASYTLTISLAGGNINGSTDDIEITQQYGTTYEIATPQRDGYTFAGWSGSGTSNLSGNTYTFNSSGNLSADWDALPVSVDCSIVKDEEYYGYAQFTVASISASGGEGEFVYSLVDSSSYFFLSDTSLTSSNVTLNFVSGAGAGSYTAYVKATSTNSSSDTTSAITVTINKGQVVASVNPSNFLLAEGGNDDFDCVASYSYGSYSNNNVSGSWSTTSANSTIAYASVDSTSGKVYAVAKGETTITLTFAPSDSANLTGNSCVIEVSVVKELVTITAYAGAGVIDVSSTDWEQLNSVSAKLVSCVDDKFGSLPSASLTGHTFDGWYTAETGDATKITVDSLVSNTMTSIYARYTPNSHKLTIKYDSQLVKSGNEVSITISENGDTLGTLSVGESHEISKDYNVYNKVTLTLSVSKANCKYLIQEKGENSSNAGYDSETIEWTTTADRTVEICVYEMFKVVVGEVVGTTATSGESANDVSFVSSVNGNTQTGNKDGWNRYGTQITFVAQDIEGYTFVGWYTTEDCSSPAVSTDKNFNYTQSLADGVMMYAKYEANSN